MTNGLRHVALRVTDVERSKRFYSEVFGMRVVWQPDPDNAYLSSGCDNLALHRAEPIAAGTPQRLDHLGFIVSDRGALARAWEWVQQKALTVVHPLRDHRDGSSSFYISDPDGVVIQLLYEPQISAIDFTVPAQSEE